MIQNFGVVMAFGIFFVACLLLFSEYNTSLSSQTSVVLFKRGSKAAAVKYEADSANKGDDEEKGVSKKAGREVKQNVDLRMEVLGRRKAASKQPRMTQIFSWHHIKYAVPVGNNGHKFLLDDVSGYVAPGKFTALMGESGKIYLGWLWAFTFSKLIRIMLGAGKVTKFFVVPWFFMISSSDC